MKFKFITIIILIILLGLILFIGVFGLSFSFKSVKDIKKDRILKKDLINELKINGIDTVYDKTSNTFYLQVPKKREGTSYVLNFNLKKLNYKITNYKTNIIKVDYEKPVEVIIFNGKYYFETKILLTNLPLININSESEFDYKDKEANFLYINNSDKKSEVQGNIKIHTRGSSSAIFKKKSYRIDFYNGKFTKQKDISIKNFYNSHSFVLMSVYRDPSKIRDKLATALWNDISNDFKSDDINSKYVELFINNEYKGLYVFTEPINRKKLKLNKSTSMIIKTSSWEKVVIPSNFDSLTDGKYNRFEIKYPNEKKLYNKIWVTFLNKMSDFYDDKIENTYSVINNTFNLNNYIDMVIFNSFTNNVDGSIGNNTYFYMKNYNDKVYIEPWDLEFTFGYTYDCDYTNCGKKINDFKDIKIILFTTDKVLNELIVKRYNYLRKNYLTEEYFDKKIDEYLEELKYVSKRDSDTWYEYDLEDEVEFIRNWIHERIKVMDSEVEKWNTEKK